MGARRRYIGTSHLFNVQSDTEFVNGLDIEVTEEGIQTAISTSIEPERKRILRIGPLEGQAIREVLRVMEQEHVRARRQAGEFAVMKPRRSPTPVPVCEVCGGLGGNQDEEGNWLECKVCAG